MMTGPAFLTGVMELLFPCGWRRLPAGTVTRRTWGVPNCIGIPLVETLPINVALQSLGSTLWRLTAAANGDFMFSGTNPIVPGNCDIWIPFLNANVPCGIFTGINATGGLGQLFSCP